MVQYRRARIPGATYFFTVTLRDRRSQLLIEHVDALRLAFRIIRRRRPFVIQAIVILPDHLHTVWKLPESDDNFPGRWKAIKACFTRALLRRGLRLKRDPNGEYNLWQRRYWEHWIRDGSDLTRHIDYIHYNPVKHGLALRPVVVLPVDGINGRAARIP
jgi:putative transposase